MGLLRSSGVLLVAIAAVYPSLVLADIGTVDYWSFRGRLGWGLEHPTEQVIYDRSDFQRLWANIHTTPANEGRGLPPVPDFDFKQEMIIAVGLGRRSTGGYSIKVQSIRDVGGELVVSYRTYSPGACSMTSQAITSPLELLRLRRSDKPVTFSSRHEVAHCSK